MIVIAFCVLFWSEYRLYSTRHHYTDWSGRTIFNYYGVMKCAIITTAFINLLLVGARYKQQQQQYHEINLINRLNDYFEFDHLIFLLDRTLDLDRYVGAPHSASDYGKFTPQSVYIFENGSGHNNTYVRNITSKETFMIVAVENLNSENGSKILAEVRGIQNVKIGVFVGRTVTLTHMVEKLFRWSWSVGIWNIFCAFYLNAEDSALSFNVFRFDPFVKFELTNVTESESLQNYFPDKIPNYHQHPLRFVKLNEIRLGELELEFWHTVAHVFNASESTVNLSYEDAVYITSESDILLHEMKLMLPESICVYPHRMTSTLVMVPHSLPYSDFVAYLQNATWKRLFAYTFLTIAVATLLLTVFGYLRTEKIDFFRCVTDVINLLMNDNAAIRYGRLHRTDAFVIVPLTFTGLIVVNGILSVFQSYLTVPIYERQINTIEDLFKSTVPFLAHKLYWENVAVKMLEDLSQHGGWNDKVRTTSLELIQEEVDKFNNSVAFGFPDGTQAQWYLEVQKRLSLKVYHLLSESLEKSLAGFQVAADYPFIEPINDLIHRLQCAGLMDKWFKDEAQFYIKKLWKMNRNRQFKSSYESNSAEFTVPTVVWCGWFASAVLFACEIIWNRVKPKFKPKFEKLRIMFSAE